jgi:hypothetical protein
MSLLAFLHQVQFGDVSHNVGVSVATNGRFSHDVSITAKGPSYNYGAEGKVNLLPENFSASLDMNTGSRYALDVKVKLVWDVSRLVNFSSY